MLTDLVNSYRRERVGRALSRLPAEERRLLLEHAMLLDRVWEGEYDPHTDFGYSTVQAGSTIIGSTSSGVTIVLSTGDGADFPGGDGTTQFNVLGWPSGTKARSTNAEWVRVTRSGDVLTVVAAGRGQTPTPARSTWAAGWQVANAVGDKWFVDLETGIKPLFVGFLAGGLESRSPQANNDLVLVPFVLLAMGTISEITVDIATAAAIDIGILDKTGTRLSHSGATTPGTGLQAVAQLAPVTLVAAAYYFGISAASTSLAIKGDGATAAQRACRRITGSHPIPSSVSVGTTRPNYVPSIGAEVS